MNLVNNVLGIQQGLARLKINQMGHGPWDLDLGTNISDRHFYGVPKN
jgi:hypothetical protein